MARPKPRLKPAAPAPQGPLGLVVEMLGIEAMVRFDDDTQAAGGPGLPDEPTSPGASAPSFRALLSRSVSKRSGVVVGDKVRCEAIAEPGEGPAWAILSVEPRERSLVKPDFSGRLQVVASNLDHVVIVVTPNDPPLRLGLVDRYLAAAHAAGIAPMICLNKADLDQDGEALKALSPYPSLGIPVFPTISRGPVAGMEAIQAALAGRRSVLVGHSGVGKSSLACALIPGLERRIGDVNETIGRGRHTTTASRLLELVGGGELVDTPGVRAFGLFGVEAAELSTLYPEFVERAASCRFRECTHIHEIRCAVQAAVQAGEIDQGRYERYISIHESLLKGD